MPQKDISPGRGTTTARITEQGRRGEPRATRRRDRSKYEKRACTRAVARTGERANRQLPGASPPQQAVARMTSSAPQLGPAQSQTEACPRASPTATEAGDPVTGVTGGNGTGAASDSYPPTAVAERTCRRFFVVARLDDVSATRRSVADIPDPAEDVT